LLTAILGLCGTRTGSRPTLQVRNIDVLP